MKWVPVMFAMLLAIGGTVNAVPAGNSDLGNGNPAGGSGNGIVLINSGNNTLTGNIVTGNAMSGIMLESSDNNNLSGNTASGNANGITFINADNNTIEGNHVTRNTASGIQLILESHNNTIYNNYLDNSRNARIDLSSTGTIWNTTPSTGNNIVGGPYMGGNFWALPDGNGWSQTHHDIERWFAPPFNVTGDGLNIDQYPLAAGNP